MSQWFNGQIWLIIVIIKILRTVIACLNLKSTYYSLCLIISAVILLSIKRLSHYFVLMSSHMNFESTGPHECLRAFIALEGAVSRMPPQMVCQMPLGCESFAASFNWASKRLLSWMNPQMSFEVTFLSKGFSTTLNRANEWFFTCL